MINDVAILFCQRDSIYKLLPGCDVFDADRDARHFRGGLPVVAHPPCAQWSSLRFQAKNIPEEKEMATFALQRVRDNGGVLEHPATSFLWPFIGLPEPGDLRRDFWGGWTMAIPQFWFGHKADKPTRLYICGIEPTDIPRIDIRFGEADFVIARHRNRKKPALKKAERLATPKAFAEFLVEIARRCHQRAGGNRGRRLSYDE